MGTLKGNNVIYTDHMTGEIRSCRWDQLKETERCNWCELCSSFKHRDKLSLKQIISIVPEVKILEQLCRGYRIATKGNGENSWVWYYYIKPRIVRLVGDGAYHIALNSCHCYDVVYDYLLRTLGAR